jgi:predicted DCC family thiol-disulfide oxidoreductase YuxK
MMPPPSRPGDRATLIYDGECGLCRAAVRWVAQRDREQLVALVPFQDGDAVARFGITLPALAAAMHLVLPDGRVFAGADAVPELLRRLGRWRWLAWLFAVPGVRPIARRLYRWIALRRRCLVRGSPAGSGVTLTPPGRRG